MSFFICNLAHWDYKVQGRLNSQTEKSSLDSQVSDTEDSSIELIGNDMMVVKSIVSDIAENPTTHSAKPNNISSMSHTMMLSNYIDALTDGKFLLLQSLFLCFIKYFYLICLTFLSHSCQRGKNLYL